jgi:hypothetical protein
MRAAVLIAALLCSGCVPVVQHGPWVRRGISAVGGGTAGAAAEWNESGQVAPIISFEGGVRAGITPNDSSASGASLGLQLPLLSLLLDVGAPDNDELDFLQFVNLDGYIALPGPRQLHLGAGMTASNFHYTPYIQAGRLDKWYATLALMLIHESDIVIVAPSYTVVRRQDTWLVQHITLTAGFGVNDDAERVLMGGLTIMMELHSKNARP